ncbi:rhodanese-related sulfurtransferase [Candidatus Dependentiae bacterium]|nr:rhodanese-related sulfurtransferase [Candidatus Dependentiae bacterium]
MGKILLYYKYVTIDRPERIVAEQRALCEQLSLKGRIFVAQEGINGTIGGTVEHTERYKELMKQHVLFHDMDIKESEGSADHFPKLKVLVKKEIVKLGIDPSVISAKDAGVHLSPEEAHALLAENPDDLIVIDARNAYESAIGSFKNAIKPTINYFRELPSFIDANPELFKNKRVLMFCTGGVRCERASAYLKTKEVAQEVYQIKGGIHRYVEAFPNGFFRGKNYVFDGRIAQKVTDDIQASCKHCAVAYDDYSNCINAECNKQIVICPNCNTFYNTTCSTACKELVHGGYVKVRVIPHKLQPETNQA